MVLNPRASSGLFFPQQAAGNLTKLPVRRIRRPAEKVDLKVNRIRGMSMNRNIFTGFVLICMISSFLMPVACIKEKFDPEKLNNSVQFSPSMAAPIGYLHFRLDSMLNDSTKPEILEIHSDGTMTLRYRQKVFSQNLADYFTFPEIDEPFTVTSQLPTLDLRSLGSDEMVIPYTFRIDFSMNDSIKVRLDSLWIKTLSMDLDLTNSPPGLNGQLQITSQSFTSKNDSLSLIMPFDGTPEAENLDGYSIILENNQLIFNVLLTMRASPLVLNQGDDIFSLHISFRDASYDCIFGYLGSFRLNLPPRTVNIDFFKSMMDGTFHFKEPLLKVYYTNSIGIPVKISMEDFYVTTRLGEHEEITNTLDSNCIPFRQNPLLLSYPDISMAREVVYDSLIVTDSLILNLNNTNMFDILELAPKNLTFSVYGTVNPPRLDSVNFIASDSRYSTECELVLPLEGYASVMVMMDTLEFNFTNFYDKPPEEIKRLAFRVNFFNGFPLEIDAQMYFADENYNIKATLIPDDWRFVRAGIPGSGCNCVPDPKQPPLEIEFPRDKIDSIYASKYILLWASVSTPDWAQEHPITLCNNHTFTAYIGVIVDADVNSADYQP